VPKGHTNVQRQYELDAIAGSPELDHGTQVFLGVLNVFGNSILCPNSRIVATSTDALLDGV